MEELPYDVLSNILIRLPGKLLGQFRCVSRPWNALLSQPPFIHSHLKHSMGNNNHDDNGNILLFFYHSCCLNRIRCTFRHSTSPHIELTNFIKIPDGFPSNKVIFTRVIGAVNGLICFIHTFIRYSIHIWNPTLSALMELPLFTLRTPTSGVEDYRFGFDPNTDDYKIVKLMVPYHGNSPVFPEVEVYSLRRGSWQLTAEKFPFDNFATTRLENEVCLDGQDGKVHWLGYILPNRLNVIVAFDLGVETFSEISLPDSITSFDEDRTLAFSFMDGKLCVMASVRGCDECEVWVMDEYYAWDKRHVFSHLSVGNDITPIGFTLNNEFFFRTQEFFYLYDPVTSNVKSFEIDAPRYDGAKIVHYVDSLVWEAPTAAAASLDRKIEKEALATSLVQEK